MSQNKIEQGFQLMEQAIGLLKRELNVSFLEAYIENGENIGDEYRVRVVDNVPNEEATQMVEKLYKQLEELNLDSEEIRKISQLLILKGMMKEPVQPNHQLTPDAIGFLFVYVIEQLLTEKKEMLKIADFTVGTGNLLYTVLLNLQLAGFNIQATGIDVDETLLTIAAVNGEWMKQEVQLYHQDSLQPLLIDPVDVAIADLPIGYYPHDEYAQKEFITAVSEGHSYAHHLLMEQSMRYVKEAGYGIFLLPSNFLETEQVSSLKEWLSKKVYLQAILRLPSALFKTESSHKSIVIVQNKGNHSKQAKEVLLAELPSLKNAHHVQEFFAQFTQWKIENIQ